MPLVLILYHTSQCVAVVQVFTLVRKHETENEKSDSFSFSS